MFRYLLIILFITLLLVCFWASFSVPLWIEWHTLKHSPWFLTTLLDLYIGLILFSIFTFWVRRQFSHTFIWTVLFFSLGNMATLAWLWVYKKEIYEKFSSKSV